MREPTFEQPRKYSLPEKNLVALDVTSLLRKDKATYFEVLSEEGIEWPVEIQGAGKSDFEKKEFTIYFPIGDVFISFAVTLHELGHLRQGEIDERFAVETLGAPKAKSINEVDTHEATEKDAYERGLDRIKRYAPEVLEEMESKFTVHKQQGKLEDFDDFQDYYDYIVKVFLTMTAFMDELEFGQEDDDAKKRGIAKLLAGRIKSTPLINKFFAEQQTWKCGELLDESRMREVIKKVVRNVAEERYD